MDGVIANGFLFRGHRGKLRWQEDLITTDPDRYTSAKLNHTREIHPLPADNQTTLGQSCHSRKQPFEIINKL